MKISKSNLKTNYYWEFKPFYDFLPNELPVPENVIEITNTKTTTEKEMTDGREFFTVKEAFGLAAKYVQEKKDGYLIWFKDASGALCSVRVWRHDDGPFVSVREFDPGNEWPAGRVSVFRNKSEKLEVSESSLNLSNFITELKTLIKKYE